MNDIDTSDLNCPIRRALDSLKKINPHINGGKNLRPDNKIKKRPGHLQKVLIANRGEIAKRFFLSLHEEGISSVAVVTDPDKGQSWYDFADEVVFIGEHNHYSDPYIIIGAAQLIHANAIYSGYGFLSENSSFVRLIDALNNSNEEKIIFMGPSYNVMRLMGDKVNARGLAKANNIPLFESSDVYDCNNISSIKKDAENIGYPVLIKPAAGGGGKGIIPVFSGDELESAVDSSMRTGSGLYNNPSFYIEKYIQRPVHIEVQIFNGWVIGLRKCAVQRRNQKIIEESGDLLIDETTSRYLISTAEKITRLSGYNKNCGAGTVEFLIDQESGKIGFLEMNTRLQVEYAVTDQSMDLDLVKCQIQLYDGKTEELKHLASRNQKTAYRNHAIECRIYAEDPEKDYIPSPGIISELDLPTFNGIRCDFGFKEGDRVLPMYDSMIGKLIVHGKTRDEALIRLERALQELYIKGVKTNVPQLLRIIRHPEFAEGTYNNNLLSENSDFNPELSEKNIYQAEGNVHIIMGAFAEYIRLFNHSLSEFMVMARIRSIIDAPAPAMCTDFTVLYIGDSFYVRFLQISFNEYYSFIDEEFAGIITLNFTNDQADNIIVNFQNRILRLRADRKSGLISLRIKNDRNKINYYNMNVYADGTVSRSQTEIIRSPFQGTVISLCKNFKSGDMIWEGEPVIILSSMKMETTIHAPVDGIISYIITEKDNSERLESDSTFHNASGISIHEGEILVKIEKGYDVYNKSEIRSVNDDSSAFFNRLFSEKFLKKIINNPGQNIRIISVLFLSIIRGYISHAAVIEMVQKILIEIKQNQWKSFMTGYLTDILESAILHILLIKKIFSQSITQEGVSCFDELNTVIREWQNPQLSTSEYFNSLLERIIQLYDSSGQPAQSGNIQLENIFLYIRLSYKFVSEYPEFIRFLLYILPYLHITEKKIIEIADLYIENDHDDQTVSLAKIIKNSISMKSLKDKLPLNQSESRLFFSDETAENKLIPIELDTVQRQLLESKIKLLMINNEVTRLDSPLLDILIYRLFSRINNTQCYISFFLLNPDYIEPSDIYNCIGRSIHDSILILNRHHSIEPSADKWVHLIISDKIITFDEMHNSNYLSYDLLKIGCSSALNLIQENHGFKGIIECNVQSSPDGRIKAREILFYKEMDKITFEFMSYSDNRNPYHNTDKTRIDEQHLFDLNKWPVELWAEECFDLGLFEEIKIRTIDFDVPGREQPKSVGAKIYIGKINGTDACFFMKDARINNGSTGDLEGLKYIAASYLSILKGLPFFVWNDGAGANIKEGIVALNRGAEGFMMNVLQTNFNTDRFRSFIMHNPDPELIALFDSINNQFGISYDSFLTNRRPYPLTLIAVGIGSSAGLDVYGSSQAAIQIMLDSEQSYRVLTGSNVIKSIIGENISNYDIGGAKRICRLTGIADIMASDKLHLIYTIRKIHSFLYPGDSAVSTERQNSNLPGMEIKHNPALVLTEEIIRRNVDNNDFIELKKHYYEADSLLGGLAKIGGQRVLIIGTRTHNGLRLDTSVIKARELLRIAQRTSSNEIIVFGRAFIQTETGNDDRLIPRLDLMNTLQSGNGLRIHIITHTDGLKLYYINNTADIVIFVEQDKYIVETNQVIRKNSMFTCSSIDEAFDLSRRVINLMPGSKTKESRPPKGDPSIPDNPTIPFDIITSVIDHVFDSESFIEFYHEMNNAETGPMLVTGMATLNGTTVGIIADHPLRKGGAADAYGTEKFRIFTGLLNRKNIPLIMLSNSSGFMPGSQQENLRIQAIGAESIDTNILGKIPVVSVVFNQNYGGRLIQAFNKFLRPGIVYLTFADSILAVIGAKVAFDLLNRKRYGRLLEEGKSDEAEKLKNDFFAEYLAKSRGAVDGIESGLVDWIIPDIKDLREHLIKGLDLAIERCDEAFNFRKPLSQENKY